MVIIALKYLYERGIRLIIGIGTDIVEIKRIEEIIDRSKGNFLQRVFTQGEIEYSNSKRRSIQHFAARFAAKEAILKALGIGFRDVTWRDMEIVNNNLGKPEVLLAGNVKEIASQKNIKNWHISLSHSDEKAIAFVIAEE